LSETGDISRPLSRHLEELRQHLKLPFGITMILIILIFPFAKEILKSLINFAPLEMENMATFSPTEFIRLKLYLSFIGSIVVSHPLWYKGFYNFSKPGLNENERKILAVCFTLGPFLFLIGAISGLLYVAPFLINILLEENELIIAKLSIYQSVKLLVSISLFSGILLSLPLLILMVSRHLEGKKTIRKYIYILIILIVMLGTPEPSMIINLIFLVFFASIMEITLIFIGEPNAN
jgi:Sec-independent protein secretion pathway component TatC